MTVDWYRAEAGEWVVGFSVYHRRGRTVINLELGRLVVTAYFGAAR